MLHNRVGPLNLMAGSDLAGKLSAGEPFRFSHGLHEHQAFTLDALAQLAAALPGDRVEYNSGDLSPHQDPDQTLGLDLSPREVVEQIESCGAWMVLKNIEWDPAYRDLLEAVMAQVVSDGGHSSPMAAGFSDIQGFVFISSAGSVTPFHSDYEENLFLHLRGRKIFHLFDNRDRSLVSDAELETYPGKHRNLAYEDEFYTKGVHHFLKPGAGLYVPHIWPHWVETGDDVAISIAVTWKTPAVQAYNDMVAVNAMLRKYGFPQHPPGVQVRRDRLKAVCMRSARALVQPLRGRESMRRWLRGTFFGKAANYYYREGGNTG